jgi:hypothetical protein
MPKRTSLSLLFVALALFACDPVDSSTSSDGGTDGSTTATIGNTCSQYVGAVCTKIIQTCAVTGQGTLSDCIQSNDSACCTASCGNPSGVSGDQLTQCLSDVTNGDCATLWDGASLHPPSSCNGVVVGN